MLFRSIRRRFGIPYVVTEHWGIYQEQSGDRFSKRSMLFQKLTKYAYSGASLSISVSEFQAKSLNKYFSSLSYQVVPNVVDIKQFKFVDKNNSVFRFIHVSDWSHNKNPEGILRAYNKLIHSCSATELVLIGGKGENYDRIHQLVDRFPDSIEIIGEVSYPKVGELMRNADCLLLFSSMENSPCVIGEALCSGLQVVASDVGGVSELVDPECCQLVPAGDEESLFRAMINSIKRSSELDRFAISQRAQLQFSYEVVGRKIFETYLKIGRAHV